MDFNIKSDRVQGKGFQVFAAVIANLIAITDGMTMGWTSPMIPYFLSDRTHIKMTREEAEWMESCIPFGAVLGLPLTAYMVNKIGRRKSLMLSCLVVVFCWIIVAIADNVIYLYVARFGKGFGLNMAFVAMPMYIGEFSHKKIRGLLTASTFVFIMIGIVTMYSIGPYVPYVVSPILAATVVTVEFVVLFFLPESPYYLMVINEREEAKSSLQRFRGGADIEVELHELQSAMDTSKEESGKVIDLFLEPNNRRAMLIMLVINFTQLFGSFEVISMNLQEIMEGTGSIYLDPSLTAIIFSVIMLIATISASLVVDRFGRKILLIISTFTSAICILTLAIYFNLKALDYRVERISWIPIVSVMFYAACFKFGLGTVPIVITAEIFSQKMKAIGMTLADGACVVASITVIQVFFYLRNTFGMHAPFYIFSGCLLIAIPYFFFCIPETKGKSLDEIQDILKAQKCL